MDCWDVLRDKIPIRKIQIQLTRKLVHNIDSYEISQSLFARKNDQPAQNRTKQFAKLLQTSSETPSHRLLETAPDDYTKRHIRTYHKGTSDKKTIMSYVFKTQKTSDLVLQFGVMKRLSKTNTPERYPPFFLHY